MDIIRNDQVDRSMGIERELVSRMDKRGME